MCGIDGVPTSAMDKQSTFRLFIIILVPTADSCLSNECNSERLLQSMLWLLPLEPTISSLMLDGQAFNICDAYRFAQFDSERIAN